MPIVRPVEAINELIKASPESSLTRRISDRILPRATITTATVLAAAVAVTQWDIPSTSLAAKMVGEASRYVKIDPADALPAAVLSYVGERAMTSIAEIIFKPLLTAERRKGREEGREQGREEAQLETEARHQQWIERQKAAGVTFVDDEDLPNPTEKDQS